MRDIKNFDKEEFLITLENKFSDIFVNNNLSVNKMFDKFFASFADVLLKTLHPSKKQLVRKKKTRTKNHGIPTIC